MSRLAPDVDCHVTFLGLLNCRAGVALQSHGQTVGALAAVLSTSAAAFVLQLAIFLLVRGRYPEIYGSQSFHTSKDKEPRSLRRWLLEWIGFLTVTSSDMECLDAYFFLRYPRMMLLIFGPAAAVAVPVLVPLHAGGSNRQTGLDRLSISNLDPQDGHRLWAHVAVAVAVVVWTLYITSCELHHYVQTLQAAKLSDRHIHAQSTTTVLIQNIPKEYSSVVSLRRLFSAFPGGVRRVWLNRDLSKLSEMGTQRMKVVEALEQAETELIRIRCEWHSQRMHTNDRKSRFQDLGGQQHYSKHPPAASLVFRLRCVFFSWLPTSQSGVEPPEKRQHQMQNHCSVTRENGDHACRSDRRLPMSINAGHDLRGVAVDPCPEPLSHEAGRPFVAGVAHTSETRDWAECVRVSTPAHAHRDINPESERMYPLWHTHIGGQHRQRGQQSRFSLPWSSTQPPLDTKLEKINHLRSELIRLNLEIATARENMNHAPLLSSAFVQFQRREAAQMCCQSVLSSHPHQMTPRLMDIDPRDIRWDNLSLTWYERLLRRGAVSLVCAILVPIYAVPIAFTSLLNKIVWLARTAPWLTWISHTPDWILIACQGILPPILLGTVLAFVPMIFRSLVRHLRLLTSSAEEVSIQCWYFTFLFVQIFLVVTVSGGITESLADVASNPSGLVSSLATNLPKASNYFLCYITAQALSASAGTLLRFPSLTAWLVAARCMDTTPRQRKNRQTDLCTVQWGTHYPPITNFAAIAMVYAIVSPLVLLLVVPAMSLFWVAYRYNILYVYEVPIDGGGISFPTAINQIFTGLYVMEACLGAFMFALTSGGKLLCLPQAIMMVFLLLGTVISQIVLNNAYGPLQRYIPVESLREVHEAAHTPLPKPVLLSEIAERSDPGYHVDSLSSSHHPRISLSGIPSQCASDHHSLPLECPMACPPLDSLDMHSHVPTDDFSHAADTMERRQSGGAYPPFHHQALCAPQPVVWLPRDGLGISAEEIEATNAMSMKHCDGVAAPGIDISDAGAQIDNKGNLSLFVSSAKESAGREYMLRTLKDGHAH